MRPDSEAALANVKPRPLAQPRNHLEITALDGRAAYIAAEVALQRASLDRIQSVIDGKAVVGTRTGDLPGAPPMRSPTPRVDVAPLDPIAPKVWPLGGL